MYTDSESDPGMDDSNIDLRFAHDSYGSSLNQIDFSGASKRDTDATPIAKKPKQEFNFADIKAPSDFARWQDDPLSPPRVSTPDNYDSTPELAGLFTIISKFQPDDVELTPHFKPFLPELIPAIGSIDAFIKIPRPDGEEDLNGLVILDEPSIVQSNPQILTMQLKEKYGIVESESATDGYIGKIEDPQNDMKALQSFVDSIEEVHRTRPPPTIIYSYRMPEISDLMEVWDEKMEQALQTLPIPSADIDLSLEEYAKVLCAILDIPVKGNIIESIHVLFSLFSQFKENQFFTSNQVNKQQ